MTSTIEVPISLIKAGDIEAIRELLPKENLFGRWAEHPMLGRGLIISGYLDRTGRMLFASAKENGNDDAQSDWIPLDSLTLDPVELTTVEDYDNAPAGTIVALNGDSPYLKRVLGDWADRFGDKRSDEGMAGTSRKVLRWGWVE